MKNETVIELNDSDDEVDTTVRSVKQEQNVVPNNQPVNEVVSNAPVTNGTNGLNVTIKTERLDEPEVGSSTQQTRAPTPLTSYNDIIQETKHFEQYGERLIAFELTNQPPIATDLKANRNAGLPTNNDVDQKIASDSLDPNANANKAAGSPQTQVTSTSLLASNEPIVDGTKALNFVMIDHQYARAHTSTEGPTAVIDKFDGENLQQGFDAEVTVKVEPMDDVQSSHPVYNYYPEVIDLISDQEDVANETMDKGQSDNDDDNDECDKSLATIQRVNQSVYNTRAGGHFKAGRWQKLTNQQTGCNDTKCSTCNIIHKNPIERPHKCSTCSKRFVRAGDLARHMKGHENKFRCSICQKGLPDASSCQSHKYHCKFTRFECHLCKKQLGKIKELLKHSKRMHIGRKIRRFTCPARLPNSKFHFDLSKLKYNLDHRT